MKLVFSPFNNDGCVILLLFIILSVTTGAFAWPYTINTWLVFMGKPATVTWYQGAILGCMPIFGQLALPAMALTWIFIGILS